MFSYLSMGVVIGILASFLTPRRSTEQFNQFFTLIHTKVRPDEKISSPCTLTEDSLPRDEKLINHPDIELPKPTVIGMGGFVLAWCGVALIIWFTRFLAGIL